MSFWRRLFPKAPKPSTAPALSLGDQFRRKAINYQKILTASDIALALMAQMQAHLEGNGYCSPAYVQLSCAAVLGYTGQAVRILKEFTKQRQDLGEIFASFAGQINTELQGAVDALGPQSLDAALPFDRLILAPTEMLASGAMYPVPGEAGEGEFIIEELWGWGLAVPDAARPPDALKIRKYRLAPGHAPQPAPPETPPQEEWLTYQPEAGLALEPLPSIYQGQSCLTPADLQTLTGYYRMLAACLGGPQRVTWALEANRELVILRTTSPRPDGVSGLPQADAPGLLSPGAITIYPGLATGPACRVEADRLPEVQDVPVGAVLLADKPTLRLAPLLDRAAALVVDRGAAHNHLAFLARARHLPTIFNSGDSSHPVPEGRVISIDAGALWLWEGSREAPPPERESPTGPRPMAASPMLERLAPWLFPLNMPALAGESLNPEACRSLHDLLFYISGARIDEMFCLSLKVQPSKQEAVSLVTGQLVPIVIIDAGGGLTVEAATVDAEAISSVPYRALIKGMLSIPWPKGRPVDVKGFMSVIGSTTAAPRADDQLEKISFALISKKYMNFSLCLGYHASTIEAYVGDNLDNNYIRFHYQGGAASLERRVRRLQLIGGILARLGFKVTVTADLLDARLGGEPEAGLTRTLEILGRLEVYTKQMDMLMSSDAVVHGYIEDFFAKHLEAT